MSSVINVVVMFLIVPLNIFGGIITRLSLATTRSACMVNVMGTLLNTVERHIIITSDHCSVKW